MLRPSLVFSRTISPSEGGSLGSSAWVNNCASEYMLCSPSHRRGRGRVRIPPLRLCPSVVDPARPGVTASPSSQPSPARGRGGCAAPPGPVGRRGGGQIHIRVRLGGGMPSSRILSEGRFIQTLSALGAVPGSRERRRRLGRSFRQDPTLGFAGAYSQMYLPICVDDLSGDPVAEPRRRSSFSWSSRLEGCGDLVVCLYELVDWVGRVSLGLCDPAVDVVTAAVVFGRVLSF